MRSFEIHTAANLLEAATEAFQDYLKDGNSTRKAVMSAMLCWHIADWAYAESAELQARFSSLRNFHRSISGECPFLQIMQDITNGTKHKDLRTPRAGIIRTSSRTGAFSPQFSRGFDRAELTIHLQDGTDTAFDIEFRKAIEFWRDVLQ